VQTQGTVGDHTMATQPAFSRRPADDSFKQLVVVAGGHPQQFHVENGPGIAGDDFDAEYVSFGAYFGSHGPHVFAAAPELRTALQLLLSEVDETAKRNGWAGRGGREAARNALAKAEAA